MKASKTLTTLSVAAAMAVGGIAIAQTGGTATLQSDMGSQSTTMNQDLGDTSNMNAGTNADTSLLGAGSDNTMLDSNLNAGSDTNIARMDRN